MLLFLLLLFTFSIEATTPVSYQGRFRPMEAYSRLWFEELSDSAPSEPEKKMWEFYFKGHSNWDDTPLISIREANIKSSLGLDLKRKLFSYNEIKGSGISKLEIYEQGPLMLLLPSKRGRGEWLPLTVLESPYNATLFPNNLYQKLHDQYLSIKEDYSFEKVQAFSTLLESGYIPLAGTPYLQAYGKSISYPSFSQLKAEAFYYTYPLTTIAIILYFLTFLALAVGLNKIGYLSLWIAFSYHTFLLALRCYILGRAPVSNMFETILYVPWIAVLASFFLYKIYKNRIILVASSATSLILLVMLKLTGLGSGMENVQAVLDSQFWLIIHVLMIVGSYGLFILAGILGHIYLIKENQGVAKCLLQCIYVGTTLLIPGTILGGIWAAQSWGRFWDWDPKESWAFISSCIYLICIHLYTFNHIKNFGLAVGSIIGLMAISFTWYGVNYILGAGLHSYGFGSGGEPIYALYLLGETLFLAIIYMRSTFFIEKNP